MEAKTGDFLPNAHVLIPRAGRGVTADNFGRFNIYVLPGDSIVFSFVGFKKQHLKIPIRFEEPEFFAVVALKEDVTLLSEVKIYPYATEEDFKKAIMEMKLPDALEREYLAKNLERSKLSLLSMQIGMGPDANSKMFLESQVAAQAYKNFVTSPLMALTNPFAWASFIKSIKRGDLKDDRWKKAYELPPLENVSSKKFILDQKRVNN